jgi:hypothetical protein
MVRLLWRLKVSLDPIGAVIRGIVGHRNGRGKGDRTDNVNSLIICAYLRKFAA